MFAEDALDQNLHSGARRLAVLPVHGGVAFQAVQQFIGDDAKMVVAHHLRDSEHFVCASAIPSKHQIVREGATVCGFADQLPAICRTPESSELVVDKRLRKVWVCRNEVQQISPDSQIFKFVEMLAGSNGAPVSFDAITQALSAARLQTDGTTTARQAKMRAKKLIVQALEVAGAADTSDPFPLAGTGCYRCRLRGFVG